MYGVKINFADDPADKPGTLATVSLFKWQSILSAWVCQKLGDRTNRKDEPELRGVFTVWHLGRDEKVWPKA